MDSMDEVMSPLDAQEENQRLKEILEEHRKVNEQMLQALTRAEEEMGRLELENRHLQGELQKRAQAQDEMQEMRLNLAQIKLQLENDTERVRNRVEEVDNEKLVLQRLGATLLRDAVTTGNARVCKDLIDQAYDVNFVDRKGKTALFHAADLHCIELLLKANANINHQDTKGQTALCHAAKHGHAEKVSLLLHNHADATIRDCEDSDPLHNAIFNSRTDAALILIGAVKPKVEDSLELLEMARESGHHEICVAILEAALDSMQLQGTDRTSMKQFSKMVAQQINDAKFVKLFERFDKDYKKRICKRKAVEDHCYVTAAKRKRAQKDKDHESDEDRLEQNHNAVLEELLESASFSSSSSTMESPSRTPKHEESSTTECEDEDSSSSTPESPSRTPKHEESSTTECEDEDVFSISSDESEDDDR
eukprot:TRINITY_DN8223_c0_g1_i3.p1 TRINITY_DN8223_c0_g1~~TRINITY_DN8223_c0_g1_i3.p1  ORF type:complete len:422 (-),score=90.55 TRINITY_DN8223_c0_g1_i3:496-1761(-)